MKKIILLLFTIIFLVSSASAATRYISDNLYTYIHSGPGTKYKIIGSVNAGKQIKVLQTSAGFTQIEDSRGRLGWIDSKYVSKQAGLKERLEKLETKYSKLNAQLGTTQDNLKSHRNEVSELKNTNVKLNEDLQKVQTLNESLNEKLDTEKTDLLLRWFSYGGMVGGIGLLLGLILPSLIPSRKKNRWS